MPRLRPLLVPLTAVWLSLHVVVTAGTLVAFVSGASSEIVCTCAHAAADHGTCPMHGTPIDASRCRLQGTPHDLATALISVFGPLALPAVSGAVTIDAPSSGPIIYTTPLSSDWIVPPESPPPRC